MGNMGYFWYNNKTRIIVGACIALLLVVIIVVVIVKNKGNTTPEGGEPTGITNVTDVTQAPFVTDKPLDGYAGAVEGMSEAYKVGMIAKEWHDDGTADEWNLVVDKKSGTCKIYKNGEDTGNYSATDVSTTGVLMSLDDYVTATNIDNLPMSKIEGAYEVDKYTGAGVVKFLLAEGARELLEVATSDYIDVYLMKNDGTKCRVVITESVMFYTSANDLAVPSIENYVNIK